MDQETVIGQIRKTNREYRKLEEEHRRLEHTLAELARRRTLTPPEQDYKKRIQKWKLAAKDRMASILRSYDHHPP